ncbi:MAG TPA: hypothetical protein VFJ90_02635 [Candidatus Didemnitutus sp.]|nr:hypothetical protein [Candidatus Didemnitutus sp.]
MKKTTKKPAAVTAAPKPALKNAKTSVAPAKKVSPSRSEPPATFISAKVDIGFGNHLYLRGEGPGLSWDRGLAMDCIGADLWAVTIKGASAPVSFKILVNDLSWNSGNDYVVEPGQSVTVAPTF